jgi:hypothetical protein
MKALSIRQPWAWLIIHGGKDVENRTWATSFRGPVLIHASKGMTRREYDIAREFVEWDVGSIFIPPFADLKRGGIIGQAEIVGCTSDSASPWFCGPFGFILANAKPLPFIPCQGALGFFTPNFL